MERAYSHFRFYRVVHGKQPFTLTADSFHAVMEEVVAEFQDCLFSHPVEVAITSCANANRFTTELIIGMYHVHLQQWLALTKTQLHRDVLVTRMEDHGGHDAAAGQELNRMYCAVVLHIVGVAVTYHAVTPRVSAAAAAAVVCSWLAALSSWAYAGSNLMRCTNISQRLTP